ncbi:MAG: dihydrofolate reductase [Nanoarchaeota archaeon]
MGNIKLIAAADENNLIGNDSKLPWPRLRPDLKHFLVKTLGNTVVMGRLTYDSIDEKYRPLKHRRNIVMSRDREYEPHPDVEVAHSLDDVLQMTKHDQQVYIIGGEKVYRQFLPYASEVVLTRIHAAFEGDAYFPELSDRVWEEIARQEDSYKGIDFSYIIYRRADHL